MSFLSNILNELTILLTFQNFWQVDELVARGCGGLEEAKERYRILLSRREKLRDEARGFQGELPRGMDEALVDIGTKIESIQRHIARLQILGKGKGGEASEDVKDQMRAKLLEDAQIVFTTLNSSGQEFFARMSVGFETVIIDEACQAVEASTLIPLLLNVKHCILVGDPKQLPATVISTSDTSAQYQRSLFERLMSEGHEVHVLDTQYRMHPAIREFPSEYFYSGVLKDGPNVSLATHSLAHAHTHVAPSQPISGAPEIFAGNMRGLEAEESVSGGGESKSWPLHLRPGIANGSIPEREKAYQTHAWFGPLRFFDLQQSRESRGGAAGGMSLRNKGEALLVGALCRELFRKYSRNGELRGKVCVLTPYRQQRAEIIQVLQGEFGRDALRSVGGDGRRSPPLGGGGRRTPPLGGGGSGGGEGGLGERRSPTFGVRGEGRGEGTGLIDVMTVDACQGQEHDIVILSCVRANVRGAVGFVNDVRRMNVALTRAKVK